MLHMLGMIAATRMLHRHTLGSARLIRLGCILRWNEGHAALRASTRMILSHLWMHRASRDRRFTFLSLLFFHRDERHATFWTIARLILSDFRMHWAGVERRLVLLLRRLLLLQQNKTHAAFRATSRM